MPVTPSVIETDGNFPFKYSYTCSRHELNPHYVFAWIIGKVEYCWCSFANSNGFLLASTSYFSLLMRLIFWGHCLSIGFLQWVNSSMQRNTSRWCELFTGKALRNKGQWNRNQSCLGVGLPASRLSKRCWDETHRIIKKKFKNKNLKIQKNWFKKIIKNIIKKIFGGHGLS